MLKMGKSGGGSRFVANIFTAFVGGEIRTPRPPQPLQPPPQLLRPPPQPSQPPAAWQGPVRRGRAFARAAPRGARGGGRGSQPRERRRGRRRSKRRGRRSGRWGRGCSRWTRRQRECSDGPAVQVGIRGGPFSFNLLSILRFTCAINFEIYLRATGVTRAAPRGARDRGRGRQPRERRRGRRKIRGFYITFSTTFFAGGVLWGHPHLCLS